VVAVCMGPPAGYENNFLDHKFQECENAVYWLGHTVLPLLVDAGALPPDGVWGGQLAGFHSSDGPREVDIPLVAGNLPEGVVRVHEPRHSWVDNLDVEDDECLAEKEEDRRQHRGERKARQEGVEEAVEEAEG
jgi:hypothetical protein